MISENINGKSGRERQFLGSEFACPEGHRALFHVLPAPLESSVSYGSGTAGGPEAIIKASQQLEKWDGFSVPGDLGIFTSAIDYPDPFTGSEAFLDILQQNCASALSRQRIPVILGGEHTVSLAAFRAICEDPRLAGKTAILQFDAHADLRDEYEGSPLSHACVMRRAHDLGLRIFQAGVRSLSPGEVAFREKSGIRHVDAYDAVTKGINRIDLPDDFPEYLYVTIDIDALDPSVIPATGTPEPGGLGWYQLLSMVESAAASRKVIGFDVVELAPFNMPGFHASDFASARLVYNVMGIIERSMKNYK